MRKPTVFISSSVEGVPIAREFALQLEPSTTPTLWSEGAFYLGKTVTESLTEAADRADFAIFVLTPDDTVFRKARSRVPRRNLMFEMGFLAGRIGLSRTFIVGTDPERMMLPFDLSGVMYVSLRERQESDLPASVAPVVSVITKVIADVGLRPERRSELSSCFISYSWRDKDFTAHLHDDLQEVGVRCWLDAKEIRVGDSISEQINRAIQAHDKMLIVLSRSSIRSSWVNEEIRKAFDLERTRESTVLFPIRLDEAVFATEGTADLARLKDRLIIDFSGWQDRSQYQRAFSRLVRDLAISASVESEGTSDA
jgi:TIR domain/Predicted nucleotide-binding protein containing TIR-like domain